MIIEEARSVQAASWDRGAALISRFLKDGAVQAVPIFLICAVEFA